MKKILSIIPARGGSKGVPRKNIRYLAGKPLIAYSIEAALKSRYIDRTVVSTEDNEIAEIAKKYGAEVIERPVNLAKDETPTIDFVIHILEILEESSYVPDIVVLLQPTSPLRTSYDIDKAIELFVNSDCDSLVSVCELEHPPYWSLKVENGYLKPVFGEEYLKKRRQELQITYMPNGAIFISTPENLYKYRTFYTPKTINYIMPQERSIDIDEEFDFLLAEFLIKNNILSIILTKTNKCLHLSGFPHITKNGRWITTRDGYWTGGFWIGLLWLSYKITKDKFYEEAAYNWAKRLEKRRFDKTFDLGFIFYPSFVLGYRITGDEYFRNIALEASENLLATYHEKSKFIHTFIKEDGKKIGRTIIDTMMNIPLLWWAYEETGNKIFYDIAYSHAMQTYREFIRSDYSTFHVIDFDLNTGETLRKTTVQGLNSSSCWSRGQAWAIYGYTTAYKTTRDNLFLETAKKLSDYFIKNLPTDYIPFWDFNDPKESVKDSSAAAIASSAFFTLYKLSNDNKYKKIAEKILNSLIERYVSWNRYKDGILKYGCFHKPADLGVNESLIWGDYYFVEAFLKFRGVIE